MKGISIHYTRNLSNKIQYCILPNISRKLCITFFNLKIVLFYYLQDNIIAGI